MHYKPLFQSTLRLTAPASLEIFPTLGTASLNDLCTHNWSSPHHAGHWCHKSCMSSSSDGLSSILEGYANRTKKQAGFGIFRRGGKEGQGSVESGNPSHRHEGHPKNYGQQAPHANPGYQQNASLAPNGQQQQQLQPINYVPQQAGRGRGMAVGRNQQATPVERVPGMPPPRMPGQDAGQWSSWQEQVPGQNHQQNRLNGAGSPNTHNSWNGPAQGPSMGQPQRWRNGSQMPQGNSDRYGLHHQKPNGQGHFGGHQNGHQNGFQNGFQNGHQNGFQNGHQHGAQAAWGNDPRVNNVQQGNAPGGVHGFMNIQKPGQPSESFWKVEAEDGRPAGQYDSRWAKKFEQKFGSGEPAVPSFPHVLLHPPPQQQPQKPSTAKEAPKEIEVPEDITVKQLAAKLGVDIAKLEEVLTEVGEQPQSQEDRVSFDAAELAAAEFDKVVVQGKTTSVCKSSSPRPAVVTVMGHVDHGKTTLLDSLRKTSVAAGEVGGITQHIGAFEVVMPDSKSSLTFLDTPGHAAFSAMRARGAKVTDLVVLVVGGDDGVMPQTREALKHIREAGCPYVVAITKVDVPQADPAKVKQQLLVEGVELEEFGGDIQAVEVAAPKGVGLRELEEALLLQADMMELKAPLEGSVIAIVVEAHMDKGLGPVATIVVKRGTLSVGSSITVGCQWGRVRVLKNADGVVLGSVLPGKPAEICGLRGVPQAGDELMVVCDDERAKRLAHARSLRRELNHWQSILPNANGSGADGQTGQSEQPNVNLVLKADTKGTAEAIRDAIMGLAGDVVGVQVVHVGVGSVCEADVMYAAATGASVMAFNTKPSSLEVQNFALEYNVDIRQHAIIYRLLDDVGKVMSDAAPLFEEEVVQGVADVLQVFELRGKRNKAGSVVAGCKVVDGHVQKSGGTIRVKRGEDVVHVGVCESLKRQKLDVEQVGKGSEFGVVLEGFTSFQQGDVLQYLIVEKRKPKTEAVIGGGVRILPEASSQKADSD